MDKLTRPTKFYAPLLFGIALLLRLLFAGITAGAHSAYWFFRQGSELGLLAESLRTGHGLSSPFGGSTGPSAFLAPGYPAILAVVFALFHPYSQASFIALMCLQALFGALTVVATMLLARHAFGIRTANLAGAIVTLSPLMLWLPTLFWETSLSVLLGAGIAALALHCAETPMLRPWLSAGVLAAFALSVNPSLLPIVICCFGWAIYRIYPRSRSMPSVGVVVFLLLSGPWAIRNDRQMHAFIPLRDNMGYELWQGNKAGSDGFFNADLHLNANVEEFNHFQQIGEVAYMHEKTVLAVAAIRADPARFFSLTCKRFFHFWTGTGRKSAGLIVASMVLTGVAGVAGLFLLWRRDRRLAVFFLLPLLLFPLPYYITHPDFRFRLVLDPLLTVLAAYAFTREPKPEAGM
jgi:4-amino-4-deoxy-L-arabinose transferase-like glycosyltransferase